VDGDRVSKMRSMISIDTYCRMQPVENPSVPTTFLLGTGSLLRIGLAPRLTLMNAAPSTKQGSFRHRYSGRLSSEPANTKASESTFMLLDYGVHSRVYREQLPPTT
jgi:hypothetical protein